MESFNAMDQETLVSALTLGRETTKELKNKLDDVSSARACEALLEKILSTYDKALAMVTWRAVKEEEIVVRENSPETGAGMLLLASSHQHHSPIVGSPLSEVSNGVSKDEKCHKNVSKKRKVSGKFSQQVRVFSQRQDGVCVDDGYSWRKYGQKDILGANHPRAYYRCTHRNSRGCLATKHVQRTEEDPSIFEVTYKGKHSCIQTSSIVFSDAVEISKPEKPKLSKADDDVVQTLFPQQMLQNLAQGLKVETDEAMNDDKEDIFPSFSFPFAGSESANQDSHFFSDADMMDGCSPTTRSSDSFYFSSPCNINSLDDIGNILLNSKYDLSNLITTPTSVIASPFEDFDFSVDSGNFDPNFPLDTLPYFS